MGLVQNCTESHHVSSFLVFSEVRACSCPLGFDNELGRVFAGRRRKGAGARGAGAAVLLPAVTEALCRTLIQISSGPQPCSAKQTRGHPLAEWALHSSAFHHYHEHEPLREAT